MARSSRSPSLGSVSRMAGSHDHNRVAGHGRSHGHAEQPSLSARLKHLVAPHSHDAADKVDNALATSDEGMRAVKISLAALGATAIAQAAVVAVTGAGALQRAAPPNIP